MIVFEKNQKLMAVFGFRFKRRDSYVRLMYAHFVHVLIFLPTIPIICFVVVNMGDITAISDAMSLGAGIISAFLKASVFLYNRKRIAELLHELQRIFEKQKRANRLRMFSEMNQAANTLTSICVTLLVITLFPICLGSLCMHLFQPELTKQFKWQLPLRMLLPYETAGHRFPYGITYALCCLSIVCGASMLVIGVCTFMSACLIVTAGLREIVEMMNDIERVFREDSNLDIANRNPILQQKIRNEIVRCFNFHHELIRVVQMIAAIFSPIIFAQYFFSIGELCTLVFGLQLGNASVDKKLINTLSSVCFLVELFIYCYFGNELVLHTEKLAHAAYQTVWYRFCPTVRPLIWMWIRRNQRQTFVRGLGMIDCSIETFLAVLNMIGSLLALLRNVT